MKKASARPQRRSSKWPSPGTSHAMIAIAGARGPRSARLGGWRGAAVAEGSTAAAEGCGSCAGSVEIIGLSLESSTVLRELFQKLRQAPRLAQGKQRQNLFLHRAGDARFFLADVDIHLAAHAELGQVDSRFDREARARHDLAVVARFEAVHVGAIAVNFLADAVPGAVDEIFSVARLANRLARHTIHFPAVNQATLRD